MTTARTLADREIKCEAFRVLLSKCLNVERRDDVLVIYDESLGDLFEPLVNVLDIGGIPATFVCIPKVYQKALVRESGSDRALNKLQLPLGIVAAISASTVILSLLDGGPESAPLRRTIIHTLRSRASRLASIPGIGPEILKAVLHAPIAEIAKDCERVAWVLGESREAELVSYDGVGRPYILRMMLDGWEREPIISSGIILPGSWGNIPPAETFCCPRSESVDGEVCINGSIPRGVLGPGQEVVLRFERGKLVEWQAPRDPTSPGFAFLDQARAQAVRTEDPNWNTFAELGVGLNPTIVALTGNSLFDEKAKGTIHVAIGDNSAFGGDVVSSIHADLVTWRPDLRLDGRAVIVRGELLGGLIDELRAAPPRSEELPPEAWVRLREGRVEYHDGVLMRRLSTEHRVNYVAIATESMSVALGRLCDLLNLYDSVMVRDFLEQNPSIESVETARLMGILNHYRVLLLGPSFQD